LAQLSRTAKEAPRRRICFDRRDPQADNSSNHVHHTPWDATAISDLADRQLVRVPMRDKILFGMLDTPVSTLQLMPEEEFQQSSFHRDWVAPNGLRDGSTTLIADMAEELM
jgi:hypothetical protein